MKIVYNLQKMNFSWQIYDEMCRNHEVIIPSNYEEKYNYFVNLDSLEETIKENSDVDYIFDFRGNLYDIIKWTQRKINMPIIIYAINVINNISFYHKMSLFATLFYVEFHGKPLLETYNKNKHLFLGMGANPYIFHPIDIKKEYDVGFFGNHYGERKYWLNLVNDFSMKNDLKVNFPQGIRSETFSLSYEGLNELYNKTKINLSFAPKEKTGRIINSRTYDIAMAGGFQLMQYTPILEDVFEIDEEIVCWKNKKELIEKILYYLENDDERENIAKKGYKRAYENYSWSEKFEKIRQYITKEKKNTLKDKINPLLDFLGKENIDTISNDPSLNSTQKSLKLVKEFLSKKGFHLNRNIKTKKHIRITAEPLKTFMNPIHSMVSEEERNLTMRSSVDKDVIPPHIPHVNFYIYKGEDLKRILFIRRNLKTVMIIKILPFKSEITQDKWNELKKIIAFAENPDKTLPALGMLINGIEFCICDFRTGKWLKTIPNRTYIRAQVRLSSYLKNSLKNTVKKYFRLFKFDILIPKSVIKRGIHVLDKIN